MESTAYDKPGAERVKGENQEVYHFLRTIFSARVPVCAATNFFKSPMVSSGLFQS